MDEIPRESVTAWKFIRTYIARIVIGLVLAVMVFAALLVWMPYHRERQFAKKIASFGGEIKLLYRGPAWVPQAIRGRLHLFDRINYIDLRSTTVPSAELAELRSLSSLENFYAIKTQFDDASLEHLKGKTKLVCLYLTNTPVTDAGMAHLKDLKNLGVLDVGRTRITGVGLRHLKGMSALTHLFVHHNQISDSDLEHLKNLQRLEVLELDGTPVGNAGLKHLVGLPRLSNLFLYDTRVTDAGLEYLKGMSNLRLLELNETQTTAEGRASLRKARPNCKISPDP